MESSLVIVSEIDGTYGWRFPSRLALNPSRTMGSSLNSIIQPLGITHDYGTPHLVVFCFSLENDQILSSEEGLELYGRHPGPLQVRHFASRRGPCPSHVGHCGPVSQAWRCSSWDFLRAHSAPIPQLHLLDKNDMVHQPQCQVQGGASPL